MSSQLLLQTTEETTLVGEETCVPPFDHQTVEHYTPKN